MKITALTAQQKDPDRVNVMIDGKFRFSLDIVQVGDLGIKVGQELTDQELAKLETESQFGKLYVQTLKYCLRRPHSMREVRDYLYRKTLSRKYKSKKTGELKERPGISGSVADRVFDRLVERGYADDEKFARFWIESRYQRKGVSRRRLHSELLSKGVDRSIVEKYLSITDRTDTDELQKIIAKKQQRYADEQKFIQYLLRQGFLYDDIKQALDAVREDG